MKNIMFPYRIDARGHTAESSDERHVRELIEQVLFTAPGERVNRPTFGCGLLRLIFEGNSEALASSTQFLVQGALQQWLADVIKTEGVAVRVVDSTLQIEVRYRNLRSREQQVAVVTRRL
jgi:phage baseplate assembly protein W